MKWNLETKEAKLLLLCRLMVFCTFLGRAWQHLRWDAPYRALLWKQSWMEPVVNLFGFEWRDWVSSMAVDAGIQNSIKLTGVFYLVCALVTLLVKPTSKIMQRIIIAGAVALFLLGGLYFMSKYFRVGQWIEYSLQITGSLFLIAALRGYMHHPRFVLALKVAIGLTFVGHGLYAVGYYPTPGPFVTMIMNGVGVTEPVARNLLVAAGVLDFVLVAMLFIPRLDKVALGYAVFWGFATASARMVSYYDPVNPIGWLDGWLYQFLMRLVHGGLPLMLLFILGDRKTETEVTKVKLEPAAVTA